jgi:hypothetical protein
MKVCCGNSCEHEVFYKPGGLKILLTTGTL